MRNSHSVRDKPGGNEREKSCIVLMRQQQRALDARKGNEGELPETSMPCLEKETRAAGVGKPC